MDSCDEHELMQGTYRQLVDHYLPTQVTTANHRR